MLDFLDGLEGDRPTLESVPRKRLDDDGPFDADGLSTSWTVVMRFPSTAGALARRSSHDSAQHANAAVYGELTPVPIAHRAALTKTAVQTSDCASRRWLSPYTLSPRRRRWPRCSRVTVSKCIPFAIPRVRPQHRRAHGAPSIPRVHPDPFALLGSWRGEHDRRFRRVL